MKKALICGISGQDGAYLAKLLLQKGYSVFGTSRDAQFSRFENLKRLGVHEKVSLHSMSIKDFRSVLEVLASIEPDEVYNLAGQTSVGLSFEQPVDTLDSIGAGTINLLECIRFIQKPIRYYNAGSSECFGDTNGTAAQEETPFRPRSPYAVAKATAHWVTSNYREAYGIYALTGILFNHESVLRPERFVTQKIVKTVCRIAAGSSEKLRLGNMSVRRDWGWAPEYVEGMWRMLQQDQPVDLVLATGHTYALNDFVAVAFESVGLDWRDHVVSDSSLLRPTDLAIGVANPSKAKDVLGWEAKTAMPDVVKLMVEAGISATIDKNSFA